MDKAVQNFFYQYKPLSVGYKFVCQFRFEALPLNQCFMILKFIHGTKGNNYYLEFSFKVEYENGKFLANFSTNGLACSDVLSSPINIVMDKNYKLTYDIYSTDKYIKLDDTLLCKPKMNASTWNFSISYEYIIDSIKFINTPIEDVRRILMSHGIISYESDSSKLNLEFDTTKKLPSSHNLATLPLSKGIVTSSVNTLDDLFIPKPRELNSNETLPTKSSNLTSDSEPKHDLAHIQLSRTLIPTKIFSQIENNINMYFSQNSTLTDYDKFIIVAQFGITFSTSINNIHNKLFHITYKGVTYFKYQYLLNLYNNLELNINYERLYLKNKSYDILSLFRQGKLIPPNVTAANFGISGACVYMLCDFLELSADYLTSEELTVYKLSKSYAKSRNKSNHLLLL